MTTVDTPEERRVTRAGRRTDRVAVVGAGVAAVALTGLLFSQIAPFSGVIGFCVIAWIVFLGLYGLLVSLSENAIAMRDRMVGAVVASLAFVALLGLVTIVLYPLINAGATIRPGRAASSASSVGWPRKARRSRARGRGCGRCTAPRSSTRSKPLKPEPGKQAVVPFHLGHRQHQHVDGRLLRRRDHQ
jgi:hypothetical protein